ATPLKSTVVIALVFGGLLATLILLIPSEENREGSTSAASRSPNAWSMDASATPPPPSPPLEPDEISVLSLVNEMADLDHLARLPRAPFVGKQESSYDRRSKRPADGE